MRVRTVVAICTALGLLGSVAPSKDSGSVEPVRLATFEVDASPPVGSPLAYDPCKRVLMRLSCRGVVLLGDEQPIVLCAVDWIGIANGGHDDWRNALAEAAGTTPERVCVHTLHQHDAPACDLSAEALLKKQGLGGVQFDEPFLRDTIARAAAAVKRAVGNTQPVTHVGLGKAKVEKVASTRRILGPDGKVRAVRYTSCRDPELRAEPEGVIDPWVRSITFYNNDTPLTVLTYYACHPQSYYRTGIANPDFPGIARLMRENDTGQILHVHFDGAGGTVGAGKYNDGSPENRMILARRLADGMKRAWETTEKMPITAADLGWTVKPVALPPGKHLHEQELVQTLSDESQTDNVRVRAARNLAWLRRRRDGHTIDLTCLRLGKARVLHMPGELAVDYQLAAQQMRPDVFVALAAYGDYGPGYICLRKHYAEGGYESSPGASRVAPEVEDVLMPAMRELLK